MANERQDRYSKLVEEKLRAESIFAGLFNRRYEGTPTAGAVKVPYRAEATIGDYNTTSGGSLSAPETNFRTLNINKDRYVNELVDGYLAAATPDGLVAERIDSAGYTLANDIDVALAALCKTSGTIIGNTTALTTSTVYDKIVDAIQAVKSLKVRQSEMWLAVDNITYGLFLKSDDFQKATTGDLEKWGNGFVGRIAGVPVFESCNLPAGAEFILGNRVYCHYVQEWMVPVAVKDLADGAHIGSSAVQGRLVSGSMVSQAGTVLVKTKALGSLTVSSSAGTETGDTKISVTESKENDYNVYKYKVDTNATTVTVGMDVSAWESWDGSSDITAATGKHCTVVEASADCKALKSGDATVTAKS